MIYNKIAVVVLTITTSMLMHSCRNSVFAYTQISAVGDGNEDGSGPKIYKAVNLDLIFPKSFNSSENVISTTPETIPWPSKTATSVVGQPYYPLPQSNRPTYTAAKAMEEQQEPILFVTPAPALKPTDLAATSSNEASSHDTQQNTNRNKYGAQMMKQNGISMQHQRLNDDNKAGNGQQQNVATGRAVDYHTSYPFGQVITPLIKNAPLAVHRKPATSFSTFPSTSSSSASSSVAVAKLAASSNAGKIYYPQVMYQQKPPSQAEIDKLRSKGKFIDRFSPSEGVASNTFKSNNGHSHDHETQHHNYISSYKPAAKTPSASNVVNSYVTPHNLYAFPPSNVNYPSVSQDTKDTMHSGAVNSYSWPASGSLKDINQNLNTANSNSNTYQYNGPISADNSPPMISENAAGTMDEGKTNDDLDNAAEDESLGVLPASAMNQGNDITGDMTKDMASSMDAQDDKTPDNSSYDTEKEYPTPPPGWLKEHSASVNNHQSKKPDIDLVQDLDFNHQPDIIFDHDHHHYGQSFGSFPSYPVYHHYPEHIYDHHHHHDHPHIEPPPPTTTTEAPPPEPPPEPRVKKYSYFYIGRKLWYIPLYFTVWFSFYVLWLILKSIARHKVNLPNHYVTRRSLYNYDLSKREQDLINQLSVSVFHKIDEFKRKYLT